MAEPARRWRCFACGRFTDEVGPDEGPTAEEAGQAVRWTAGVLDVRGPDGGCRAAVACWACFWRADPDLWISSSSWDALSPLVPFAAPPGLDHDAAAPWDPSSYPWPP